MSNLFLHPVRFGTLLLCALSLLSHLPAQDCESFCESQLVPGNPISATLDPVHSNCVTFRICCLKAFSDKEFLASYQILWEFGDGTVGMSTVQMEDGALQDAVITHCYPAAGGPTIYRVSGEITKIYTDDDDDDEEEAVMRSQVFTSGETTVEIPANDGYMYPETSHMPTALSPGELSLEPVRSNVPGYMQTFLLRFVPPCAPDGTLSFTFPSAYYRLARVDGLHRPLVFQAFSTIDEQIRQGSALSYSTETDGSTEFVHIPTAEVPALPGTATRQVLISLFANFELLAVPETQFAAAIDCPGEDSDVAVEKGVPTHTSHDPSYTRVKLPAEAKFRRSLVIRENDRHELEFEIEFQNDGNAIENVLTIVDTLPEELRGCTVEPMRVAVTNCDAKDLYDYPAFIHDWLIDNTEDFYYSWSNTYDGTIGRHIVQFTIYTYLPGSKQVVLIDDIMDRCGNNFVLKAGDTIPPPLTRGRVIFSVDAACDFDYGDRFKDDATIYFGREDPIAPDPADTLPKLPPEKTSEAWVIKACRGQRDLPEVSPRYDIPYYFLRNPGDSLPIDVIGTAFDLLDSVLLRRNVKIDRKSAVLLSSSGNASFPRYLPNGRYLYRVNPRRLSRLDTLQVRGPNAQTATLYIETLIFGVRDTEGQLYRLPFRVVVGGDRETLPETYFTCPPDTCADGECYERGWPKWWYVLIVLILLLLGLTSLLFRRRRRP